MDDLISRHAAIDALHKEIIKRRLLDDVNDGMLDEFDTETILKKLPSAQPEQKKGRWILSDDQRREDVINGNFVFICSECGRADLHSKAVTVPFCWNCGTQMKEKIDDVSNC